MSSKTHDKIVSFVAGKMHKMGFDIKYMEGSYVDVINYKPELPPKLTNHRPDVYGVKLNGTICIGEAKTSKDLYSKRTKLQFIDFVKIVRENPDNILILGIPLGVREELTNVLKKIGITLDNQINVIEIPEQFLPRNDKEV